MRKWFDNFMSGRYGSDNLSRFLLGVCLVCLVLSFFVLPGFFYVLALAALIWGYYRMLSRNCVARSEENEKYLEIKDNLLGRFQKTGQQASKRASETKDYHIYKCPSCGQKIRIPRGKGKICITCPKCGQEFQKRS